MVNVKKVFFPLLVCLCMLAGVTAVQAKTETVEAGEDVSFSYDSEERTVYVGQAEDVFGIQLLSGEEERFKAKFATSDKTIAEISQDLLLGKKAGTVKVVVKVFYDDEQIWRGVKNCTVLNDLSGKRMLCLGDSLMYGHNLTPVYSWPQLMKDAYGMGKVYNKGKNGLCISGLASKQGTMLNHLKKKVLGKVGAVDYIVIEGGANDYHDSVVLGEPTSTKKTTFCGGLNAVIDQLQKAYPEAKIFCMTNYCRAPLSRLNDVGATAYDYVDAMEQVCALRGIPCFNNYFDSGLNLMDPKCVVWADEGYVMDKVANQHLSKEAYEYLMPIYADFLMKN